MLFFSDSARALAFCIVFILKFLAQLTMRAVFNVLASVIVGLLVRNFSYAFKSAQKDNHFQVTVIADIDLCVDLHLEKKKKTVDTGRSNRSPLYFIVRHLRTIKFLHKTAELAGPNT